MDLETTAAYEAGLVEIIIAQARLLRQLREKLLQHEAWAEEEARLAEIERAAKAAGIDID